MDADPAAVEQHLRRLPREALAALVADLWAARGYDTRREANSVIASRSNEQVVIGIGDAGSTGSVDIVVAPNGTAATDDVRILDAAALREMLWYAVDRETTLTLCERHFGAPPGGLDPPVGFTRALSVSGRRVRGLMARGAAVARPGVVVFVLAVVGVILATAVGQPLAGGAATGPSVGGGAVSTDTPAAVPTDGRSPYPRLGAVSGVNASGVTEPATLSATHDRTLESQYTIWMDVYWRPNGTDGETERQRDVDVAVAGDRYLLRAETETAGTRRPTLSVYRNGTERYVATYEDGGTRTRRLSTGQDTSAWVPEPARLRTSIGTRFLATPASNVTGVVYRDGRTYYRVAGRGTPPSPLPRPGDGTAPPTTVGNYTVVALVTSRGVVADLEARYLVDRPAETIPVRFQLTYDRRGRTTVDRPDWVAQAAPNESAAPSALSPPVS